MMEPMNEQGRVGLPDQLVAARAVVLLPPCSFDDAVAPVEVLLQEGLNLISVAPGGQLTPQMLRRTFGPRLTVAVHDLRTAADAAWAIEQDACFALTMAPDAESGLASSGMAYFPGALTPTEVVTVWRGAAAGVQVVPAGVFGNTYAAQLAELVPGVQLLPRGAESTYEVKAWLSAGAVAACLSEKLLGDALQRGDLGALRTRARALADAIKRS